MYAQAGAFDCASNLAGRVGQLVQAAHNCTCKTPRVWYCATMASMGGPWNPKQKRSAIDKPNSGIYTWDWHMQAVSQPTVRKLMIAPENGTCPPDHCVDKPRMQVLSITWTKGQYENASEQIGWPFGYCSGSPI